MLALDFIMSCGLWCNHYLKSSITKRQ